jgi:hypothetical protein
VRVDQRVGFYTTDVDQLLPRYGVLAGRLAAAAVAPTTTMLGVSRLASPGQSVELEEPPSHNATFRPLLHVPTLVAFSVGSSSTQMDGLRYSARAGAALRELTGRVGHSSARPEPREVFHELI